MILLFRSAFRPSPSLYPDFIYKWGGCLLIVVGEDRVYLHATDESALKNGITMDALKKYAAEGEAQGGGGRLEKKEPLDPATPGGIARETH